jgi:hypothetical protein
MPGYQAGDSGGDLAGLPGQPHSAGRIAGVLGGRGQFRQGIYLPSG